MTRYLDLHPVHALIVCIIAVAVVLAVLCVVAAVIAARQERGFARSAEIVRARRHGT